MAAALARVQVDVVLLDGALQPAWQERAAAAVCRCVHYVSGVRAAHDFASAPNHCKPCLFQGRGPIVDNR
jgi:hypothetical protein